MAAPDPAQQRQGLLSRWFDWNAGNGSNGSNGSNGKSHDGPDRGKGWTRRPLGPIRKLVLGCVTAAILAGSAPGTSMAFDEKDFWTSLFTGVGTQLSIEEADIDETWAQLGLHGLTQYAVHKTTDHFFPDPEEQRRDALSDAHADLRYDRAMQNYRAQYHQIHGRYPSPAQMAKLAQYAADNGGGAGIAPRTVQHQPQGIVYVQPAAQGYAAAPSKGSDAPQGQVQLTTGGKTPQEIEIAQRKAARIAQAEARARGGETTGNGTANGTANGTGQGDISIVNIAIGNAGGAADGKTKSDSDTGNGKGEPVLSQAQQAELGRAILIELERRGHTAAQATPDQIEAAVQHVLNEYNGAAPSAGTDGAKPTLVINRMPNPPTDMRTNAATIDPAGAGDVLYQCYINNALRHNQPIPLRIRQLTDLSFQESNDPPNRPPAEVQWRSAGPTSSAVFGPIVAAGDSTCQEGVAHDATHGGFLKHYATGGNQAQHGSPGASFRMEHRTSSGTSTTSSTTSGSPTTATPTTASSQQEIAIASAQAMAESQGFDVAGNATDASHVDAIRAEAETRRILEQMRDNGDGLDPRAAYALLGERVNGALAAGELGPAMEARFQELHRRYVAALDQGTAASVQRANAVLTEATVNAGLMGLISEAELGNLIRPQAEIDANARAELEAYEQRTQAQAQSQTAGSDSGVSRGQ